MQVEASSRSLGSRSSLIFADGTKAPLTIVIFIILVAFFPVTQLLSASELLPQIQTKNQASLPLVRTSQSSNYFVLHIGPPKTGTTAIQSQIVKNKKVRSKLALDNYDVIDHDIIHSMDLLTSIKNGSYTFSDKFLDVINVWKSKQTQSNIFGSSEYFYSRGAKACSSVKKLLHGNTMTYGKKHRKLLIVVTYRRLYDAWPSGWNQRFKYHRENGRHPGPHTEWPEDGGSRIPPFDEWIDQFLDQHDMIRYYNDWKSCSDDIVVVNYHDNKVYPPNGTLPVEADLATNFVCNGIIGASHTCSFLLQQEKLQDENYNTRVNLGPDMLAVHVHDSGLISKAWKRKEVAQKIETFAASKQESGGLPMRCPNSTTLQRMYDHALNFEETILMDKNMTQQRFHFDLGWKESLVKEKLCTWDVAEIVKRKEWKIFFSEALGHQDR